jgi:hypothetical protein
MKKRRIKILSFKKLMSPVLRLDKMMKMRNKKLIKRMMRMETNVVKLVVRNKTMLKKFKIKNIEMNPKKR